VNRARMLRRARRREAAGEPHRGQRQHAQTGAETAPPAPRLPRTRPPSRRRPDAGACRCNGMLRAGYHATCLRRPRAWLRGRYCVRRSGATTSESRSRREEPRASAAYPFGAQADRAKQS
jgi:hypothetical protein